jgi:hypothetical protein
MRVLIDVTHPAQAHFFHYIIERLRERGHEVAVAAREKEVTLRLLEAWGVPHVCLSRKAAGLLGMGWELLVRNARMLRYARSFRPDVLLCINAGVSVGPVGFLLGLPSVVVEENEIAWLQRLIGLPFCTHILTGTGYTKRIGRRQAKFRGIWVQAYLNPPYFRPDPEPLRQAGVDLENPYVVMRTIQWAAAHDVGLKRSSRQDVQEAVERLSQLGRVILTCEGSVPDALAHLRSPVSADRMHDLLAFASLYIGEGVTMAAEAAVLGIPSVLCNHYQPGYIRALERRYGLLHAASSLAEGLPAAEQLLGRRGLRDEWQDKRARLMEETDDIVEFVVQFVERIAAKQRGGSDQ